MFLFAWRMMLRYWLRGSAIDRVTILPVVWALVVALTIGDRLSWPGLLIRGYAAWLLTGLPAYLRIAGFRARPASYFLVPPQIEAGSREPQARASPPLGQSPNPPLARAPPHLPR